MPPTFFMLLAISAYIPAAARLQTANAAVSALLLVSAWLPPAMSTLCPDSTGCNLGPLSCECATLYKCDDGGAQGTGRCQESPLYYFVWVVAVLGGLIVLLVVLLGCRGWCIWLHDDIETEDGDHAVRNPLIGNIYNSIASIADVPPSSSATTSRAPEPVLTKSVSSVETAFMAARPFCGQCGTRLTSATKYCRACGQLVG